MRIRDGAVNDPSYHLTRYISDYADISTATAKKICLRTTFVFEKK